MDQEGHHVWRDTPVGRAGDWVQAHARMLWLVAGTTVGLGVGLFLFNGARDARHVNRAEAMLAQGRYGGALQQVDGIHAAPAGAVALNIRAHALAGLGQLYPALKAYKKAAERAPSDWELRRDWAQLLLRVGQRRSAGIQMGRALALNPRLRIPEGFIQP